jgi:mono/diheme cytochrome c family protein
MRYQFPALILLGLLVGCAKKPEPTISIAIADAETRSMPIGDPVEGLRVATRVGCNGCHTSTGGGKVFSDEPGVMRIVAPNLTERRLLYDDAGIAALLHRGKTHDGHRPLGMPIKMFQYLSDHEVRDITAWLRALPAVNNPDLPKGMLSDEISKQLSDGTFPFDDDLPDPIIQSSREVPTETLALGKHLAMTSCPECHAPDLNGFPGDVAPSLIIAKAYTPEKFVRLMKTGMVASGKESKTGLMTRMSEKRFSVMTDTEVNALKVYLDSR